MGAPGFSPLPRSAAPLLACAPAGAVATPWARVRYLLLFALLPMFIGTVLAFAYRAPPMGHLTMPLFSALFFLPWSIAVAALLPAPEPVSDRMHRAPDIGLLVANLVLLAIYWLILAPGLAV